MKRYFYDSYAIIEYINDNPMYTKYFLENEGVTSFNNLMEVFYSILKEGGEKQALQMIELLKNILVEPVLADISKSMNFKLKNKKINFSYIDCLGYSISNRLGIIFLTGNEGFRNLPNVEFVKAR